MAQAPREHSADPSEDLKERITTAAEKLFLREGFDRVSLDDIVRDARISKSSIYSHFGGKEGVFSAVIKRALNAVVQTSFEPDGETTDARQHLLDCAVAYLQLLAAPRQRALFRVCAAMANRLPDLSQQFLDSGPDKARALLTESFRRWSREGVLKVRDPTSAAEQFLGTVRGGMHLRMVFSDSYAPTNAQIDAYARKAVDAFLNGVLPRN